jgi:hypothetical protein
MLDAAGFDVAIVNLKSALHETPFGTTKWRSRTLTKVSVGTPHEELDPRAFDVWGITVNYLQEREPAEQIIRHLKAGRGRVVVGGSDAIAVPHIYLAAGADAVVVDKSGAANVGVLRAVAGLPTDQLHGVLLADGTRLAPRRPPMKPQEWPLPKPWMVRATLGTSYWEAPLPERLLPIGAVMLDVGCDRHCDFCQTPTYGVGYGMMTPERSVEWLAAQKQAGAESVVVLSDQFLGRVLWPEGSRHVKQILQAARELRLPVLWGNGIELSKATVGRGKRGGSPEPDHELVEAVWGWDGEVGCAQAYIPAERPVAGASSYAKLLPWRHHVEMMKAITRAGVPDINYGVIVGLADDTHQSLAELATAVTVLRDELKNVNPHLKFRVTPYAIRPLPGTLQARMLRDENLLRFDDPSIQGGFWTACADTRSMSYEEVSDWQIRLVETINEPEPDWQGITGLHTSAFG